MIAIFTFTDRGKALAASLEQRFIQGQYAAEKEIICCHKVSRDRMKTYMIKGNLLIFISAAGIAVRMTAPFLTDKASDPAVLVMDDTAKHVIALLSGHLGEANRWTELVAGMMGAEAVITTATDCNGIWAVDTFAVNKKLRITDIAKIKYVSAKLLRGEQAAVWAEPSLGLLAQELIKDAGGACCLTDEKEGADIILTNNSKAGTGLASCCVLVPMDIIIGIGCRRGKTAEELYGFIREICAGQGIDMYRIRSLHSIDKKEQEEGLRQVARQIGVPFLTYTAKVLSGQEGEFSASEFVEHTVGVDNVCERSAVAGGGKILLGKQMKNGMTLALASAT